MLAMMSLHLSGSSCVFLYVGATFTPPPNANSPRSLTKQRAMKAGKFVGCMGVAKSNCNLNKQNAGAATAGRRTNSGGVAVTG